MKVLGFYYCSYTEKQAKCKHSSEYRGKQEVESNNNNKKNPAVERVKLGLWLSSVLSFSNNLFVPVVLKIKSDASLQIDDADNLVLSFFMKS